MLCVQLLSYDKEKDYCKQISCQLEELKTSKEHLKSDNAHLRQQLKLGVEDNENFPAKTDLSVDTSSHMTDFDLRHQLRVTDRDKSGSSERDKSSSCAEEFTDSVTVLRVDNKQLKDELLLQRIQITSLQQRLADVTQVILCLQIISVQLLVDVTLVISKTHIASLQQ